MKFGYFTLSDNPPFYEPNRRDPNQFLREILAECLAAEDLGFDSVWVPEHHFGLFGCLPSPTTFLGYVAARFRGRFLDNATVLTTLVGVAVPVFFLGVLLKYIFAQKLGILPPSGRQDVTIDATHPTGFYVLDGLLTGELASKLAAISFVSDRFPHTSTADQQSHREMLEEFAA